MGAELPRTLIFVDLDQTTAGECFVCSVEVIRIIPTKPGRLKVLAEALTVFL